MESPHPNHLREHRTRLGLTQGELAARCGISRAAVSAVEQGAISPSVDAALRLARALGCRVEDLFAAEAAPAAAQGPLWSAKPGAFPTRVWQAQVGSRLVVMPVEPTAAGLLAHDRILAAAEVPEANLPAAESAQSLVLASCDPAASLSLALFARDGRFRPLCLGRTSAEALDLLARGAVHLAGIHFATEAEPLGNARAAAAKLGSGHSLLRAATWETGVAVAPDKVDDAKRKSTSLTLQALLRRKLRWVGRAEGSGARACQDQVLGKTRAPKQVTPSHRAVAEAIRMGYADAGICTRLVAQEAGLAFVPVRRERFDFCLRSRDIGDPRVAAFVEVVRSRLWRNAVAALPGYAIPSDSGEIQAVA